MIISREEFNQRWPFREFKTIREKEMLLPIEPLMKEIKADAKFRNHEYLFDGSDLTKVKCHDEVGVNLHCNANVKTEAERMAVIDKQIKNWSYRPVPIFQHIDHPSIIYIDDRFHRIYSAWKQKKQHVNCKVKVGKFVLSKSISLIDLHKLIGMLIDLFPEHHDMKKLKNFLENEADQKKLKHATIDYGKEEVI